MTTIDFIQEFEPFGKWSQGLGLGIESEQIQRAAKAQIMNYLPEITEQLQTVWEHRDKEYIEKIGGSYKRLVIPSVEKKHFFTGTKHISVLKADLDLWPFVITYASDAKPYAIQEDQFDTYSVPLCVEIFCCNGPIENETELHTERGWEIEQELDSMLQRLSDAVLMCIRKDPSLGGVVGQIEKPNNATTSLPWSRKEAGTETGNYYIFQGKQFDFTVQKMTY
jgi:hypothetical protein